MCVFLILTVDFFFVTEVEKQLQGSEAIVPLGTPHLSYKKSHSGSTGNLHGLGLSEASCGGKHIRY